MDRTTGYAWDHGDYAAEINNNWAGFVGPGVRRSSASTVRHRPKAQAPPVRAAARRHQFRSTIPGTWIDETDIQPTMLDLTGLRDDYIPDGRVVSQILTEPSWALERPSTVGLSACYKQLDSSVGEFGAATLIADTNAIELTSAGDITYRHVVAALQWLEAARDGLAGLIKGQLAAAAFRDKPIPFLGTNSDWILQPAHRPGKPARGFDDRRDGCVSEHSGGSEIRLDEPGTPRVLPTSVPRRIVSAAQQARAGPRTGSRLGLVAVLNRLYRWESRGGKPEAASTVYGFELPTVGASKGCRAGPGSRATCRNRRSPHHDERDHEHAVDPEHERETGGDREA